GGTTPVAGFVVAGAGAGAPVEGFVVEFEFAVLGGTILVPGFVGAGEAAGDPFVPSSADFCGTEGRRCARMSEARMGPLISVPSGAFSTTLVMTNTSSTRLRSAAGVTRMFRNMSLPGATSFTV